MINVHKKKLDAAACLPGLKEVLTELGYPDDREADAFIVQQLDTLMADVAEKAEPRFVYRRLSGRVDEMQNAVWVGDVCLRTGHIIASLMKGSSEFAVFAATAGEYVARRMNMAAQKHDVLEEYLLSAIGSCLVEKTGDCMEQFLQTDICELKHTKRFSPGYCGWELSDQKELFRLLGGKPCGIVLSKYCLMSPIKSISGLIGIGSEVNQYQYGCTICNLKTCYKRKKKNYEQKHDTMGFGSDRKAGTFRYPYSDTSGY